MSLSHQVDSIIEAAIEHRVFPGAVVLIAKGDCICHYQAYGTTMYDADASRPVRLDTIYDIASLTKMFTATAALRLGEADVLEIDAPVAGYLPGFGAPEVTIRHLLTHTSGLDIRLSALRQAGRDALLETVYNLKPAHPPGSVVAYTNVNSLLLGEIVARLHGASLDQALHDLVIGPLGLCDTCFCPPGDLKPRIAPTEVDEAWRGGLVHGSVHDESAHTLGGIAGHAGLFSTAADIHRFCSAWLAAADGPPTGLTCATAEPLLRPETARRAMASQTQGLSTNCGLGWMIDRPNFMGPAPTGIVGHTGFTGPAMVIAHASRTVVVVLNNRVYPKRGVPAHHSVTSELVSLALSKYTPQARSFVV